LTCTNTRHLVIDVVDFCRRRWRRRRGGGGCGGRRSSHDGGRHTHEKRGDPSVAIILFARPEHIVLFSGRDPDVKLRVVRAGVVTRVYTGVESDLDAVGILDSVIGALRHVERVGLQREVLALPRLFRGQAEETFVLDVEVTLARAWFFLAVVFAEVPDGRRFLGRVPGARRQVAFLDGSRFRQAIGALALREVGWEILHDHAADCSVFVRKCSLFGGDFTRIRDCRRIKCSFQDVVITRIETL